METSKRNLYKDLPERSGGSIIVCNKCRATKNYFWKKRISFKQTFCDMIAFLRIFIIYNCKRYALKKNGNNMLLHSNSSFLVTFYYTLKQKKTADTHHQTSNRNNQILIKITFVLEELHLREERNSWISGPTCCIHSSKFQGFLL